jgi:DNA-binding transcriptional MerR regulator
VIDMDWSIQEVARLAGVTSRTLRHYDAVGLLPPSRVAAGGTRRYDRTAIVRLQRILLLRELGLGLEAVGRVLAEQTDEARALRDHLDGRRRERDRIDRQIASVRRTLAALADGLDDGPDDDERETIMAADMLDGFDHTRYREEVEQRWGREAYATGDAWWRGLGDEQRREFLRDVDALSTDWQAAWRDGADPAGERAQALAERHTRWLAAVPGTPGHAEGRPPVDYVLGLAEMYVADERFARNYGGTQGAAFVRDALTAWAAAHR